MPPIQYTTSADGVSIAWTESGTGPTLIVSDGPTSPMEMGWEPDDLSGLLARDHRVIRFDVRGCGLSSRADPGTSWDQDLLDLQAVIAASAAEQYALLGWFLGSPTAAMHAAAHPPALSHLILYSATQYGGPPDALQAEQQRTDELVELLIQVGWETDNEVARRALVMFLMPEADMDTVRANADLLHDYISAERLQRMMRNVRELDIREHVRAITTPTLVAHRRHDLANEVESGQGVAASIAGSRFLMLPGRSTVIQPHDPALEMFVSALTGFVRDRDPAQASLDAQRASTRTILFTDVEASTNLTDRFGDAKARDLLRQHERLTREALTTHAGTEIKTMGDGFMASFSSASAALDAAIAMQLGMETHFGQSNTPIRIRVGVNAGEPIAEDDDLYGTAVIQAARVMAKAAGGQILVTDTVRNLVAGKHYRFSNHGTHDLKGFEEPARLFDVAWSAERP